MEQELLAIAHTVLDDGRDVCPTCSAVVEAGIYCGECGEVLHEIQQRRTCPAKDCGYHGPARFCPRDGERVIPKVIERVNSGKSSWKRELDEAWALARTKMPPEEDDAARARRLAMDM